MQDFYRMLKALDEKAYVPNVAAGQKTYVGSAEPFPEASGTLTKGELGVFARTLGDPNLKTEAAFEHAGLRPPSGFSILQSGRDGRALDERRVLRHERENAVLVAYSNYDPDIWFELPLTHYNDGGGKGFYTLDENANFLFGDVLQVPYAKEQLHERLRAAAQSSKRSSREAARLYLKMVFGK